MSSSSPILFPQSNSTSNQNQHHLNNTSTKNSINLPFLLSLHHSNQSNQSNHSISSNRSNLNLDPPFSPISSHLKDIPKSDHPSTPSFSPSDHSSIQQSHTPTVSLTPFENSSNDSLQRLSFDSSLNSQPFQPASLPVPKRPLANIWAQPQEVCSSSTSDLGLGSPSLGQIPTIDRRLSYLGPTQPISNSRFGSPAGVLHPIGPISLSTDRYRGSLTPTSASPLSAAAFGPNSLPANFYQPWHGSDSSSEALFPPDERLGRSKARDILGSRSAGSYRDPSVGSMGSPSSSSARSGIGLSNMSPFTGTSLLPPGGLSIGGSLVAHHAEPAYRTNRGRESSLGAIGSGRMASRSSVPSNGPVGSGLGLARSGSRILNKGSDHVFVGSVGTDSWLTGGRSLSNDLDEDDELAQPTKSGATSRRHSVSAFTGRGLVQGFDPLFSRPNVLVSTFSSDSKKFHRNPNDNNLTLGNPRQSLDNGNQGTTDLFGRGSSALTDEDLCFTADLDSLNLDLEAQPNRDRDDRLSFQLSHTNPFQSSQPSSQLQLTYPDPSDSTVSQLNNMPWSSLTTSSQDLMLNSNHSPLAGPTQFARKSSYSAGDPFSASAQASRYFASQSGTQQSLAPRIIPFGHLQPLGSISSPSVTTFSASGLLSAPLPHSRQMHNPEIDSNQTGPMASMGPSPFDPPSANSFYSAPNSNNHFCAVPFSPMLPIPSGLSGPSPNTQFSNVMSPSPRSGSTSGLSANELNDLGKGIPLHQIPRDGKLYIVEFKGARTDLFYLSRQAIESGQQIQKGDLVIVEADRGQDLGKVVHDQISIEEVRKFQNQHAETAVDQTLLPALSQLNVQPTATDGVTIGPQAGTSDNLAGDANSLTPSNPSGVSRLTKEIHPKKIFGKAGQTDIQSLLQKTDEERKALSLCRSKALQRGLQMEITSAEWQWDRRKLTFFFIADKRIDFRDLVKDLFRTWKTRIWMCSVNP